MDISHLCAMMMLAKTKEGVEMSHRPDVESREIFYRVLVPGQRDTGTRIFFVPGRMDSGIKRIIKNIIQKMQKFLGGGFKPQISKVFPFSLKHFFLQKGQNNLKKNTILHFKLL